VGADEEDGKEGGDGDRGKKRAIPEGRVDDVRDLPYDFGMIVGIWDLWSCSYNHPQHNKQRRNEQTIRPIQQPKSNAKNWTKRPT
jgi:hypothetical protein